MDLSHLAWPFFDADHRQFAAEFARWAVAHLCEFEQCDGGDGSDARQIFKLLAAAGWLDKTLPQGTGRLDLRSVSLLREICGHSSAMADVALSEPWLGILPVALYASLELKQQFLSLGLLLLARGRPGASPFAAETQQHFAFATPLLLLSMIAIIWTSMPLLLLPACAPAA